jgi:hypothetical protein
MPFNVGLSFLHLHFFWLQASLFGSTDWGKRCVDMCGVGTGYVCGSGEVYCVLQSTREVVG